jgi:hypothetical protein
MIADWAMLNFGYCFFVPSSERKQLFTSKQVLSDKYRGMNTSFELDACPQMRQNFL